MSAASVVVCCYNSAARLPDTLAHLARLEPPAGGVEVVLVDNGSTDDTARVAGEAWASAGAPFPFAVVAEPELGLSHARRRGILAARHETVVFCDDDNWLSPSYLREADALLAGRPEVGAICGHSLGRYQSPPPDWLPPVAYALAVGHGDRPSGALPERMVPWGAGLVIRKRILDRLFACGFESLLSDRQGDALSSGGDTEYCILARVLGYSWWYESRMTFEHFVPAGRLTEDYFRRLFHGFGRAECLIQYYYKWGRAEQILGQGPMRIGVEYAIRRAQRAFAGLSPSRADLSSSLDRCRRDGFLDQLRAERERYRSRYLALQDFVRRLVDGRATA